MQLLHRTQCCCPWVTDGLGAPSRLPPSPHIGSSVGKQPQRQQHRLTLVAAAAPTAAAAAPSCPRLSSRGVISARTSSSSSSSSSSIISSRQASGSTQLHAAARRATNHSSSNGGGATQLAAAASEAAGAAPGAAAPHVEGVVIVDHGSRKAESNHMLHEFAELYKRTTGRPLVEVAHMELAEPTIEQAVGRCAAAGAARVIIAPYFLSRGRHIQHDIPALAAAAAAAHPGVECVVAEPIGIDALMAQLIENRVAAAAESGGVVDPSMTAAAAAGAVMGAPGGSGSSSGDE